MMVFHDEFHRFAKIRAAENREAIHSISCDMGLQAGSEGEVRIAGQPHARCGKISMT